MSSSGKGPYKSVDEEAPPVIGAEPPVPDSEFKAQSTQLEIEAPEEKEDNQNEKPILKPEDSKIKEKTDNAPKLPYLVLFAKFLWFGCRGETYI